MKIIRVYAYEVLDSFGLPTIACIVQTDTGAIGKSTISMGKTKSINGCVCLIDHEMNYYDGNGLKKAIHIINHNIANVLLGIDVTQQKRIDEILIMLDGTNKKTFLGANTTLAVSLAVAKAAANELHIPLYKYLREKLLGNNDAKYLLPLPFIGALSRKILTNNKQNKYQEFMIVPLGATSSHELLQQAYDIKTKLKEILIENNYQIIVSDDGSFCPYISDTKEILDLLKQAITKAGYIASKEPKAKHVAIAINLLANDIFNPVTNLYQFKWISFLKDNDFNSITKEKLYEILSNIYKDYPLISLEDPFSIYNQDLFVQSVKEFGNDLQIVGDAIYNTNAYLVRYGIKNKLSNSVLIKPSEVGTLSETIEAILCAKQANWTALVSNEIRDTADTFIVDLAVALGTGMIKIGGLHHSEHLAKYNRLLEIENELQNNAINAGGNVFYNLHLNKNNSN